MEFVTNRQKFRPGDLGENRDGHPAPGGCRLVMIQPSTSCYARWLPNERIASQSVTTECGVVPVTRSPAAVQSRLLVGFAEVLEIETNLVVRSC